MKDRLKNTKKHLKQQIDVAKALDSKWVYILVSEAEKCLELAEVEDTLFASPEPIDIEGGCSNWWHVCGECRTPIDVNDHYCRNCGRKVKWE